MVGCVIGSSIGLGVVGGGSSMIGSDVGSMIGSGIGVRGRSMNSLKFFLCLSRYCFWNSFLCATLSSSVANRLGLPFFFGG